jgi:tetratricopeptide (TPR) repeat protein
MLSPFLGLALSVSIVSQAPPPGALSPQNQSASGESPDFAAAKALYASASYEEALAELAGIRTGEDPNEVEQYRALCLLALGRTTDAERSLERIVSRTPFYSIRDADVSPRLVSMFRDVRKRLLPTAARNLYTSAKGRFDEKEYADAATQFKELLAVLADPDLADQYAALADLRQLGDGFLKLSEAELATTGKAAAVPAPPPAASPAPNTAPRIYSSADRDVRVPVELSRRLPQWTPANPAEARTVYRGVLEVIIDEQGVVESAAVREPVAPFYDAQLIEAARTWRFRPATLNSEPVRYRKLIEITLQPTR